jgi:hypothetical protein
MQRSWLLFGNVSKLIHLTLLQPHVQVLKTGTIAIDNIGCDRFSRRAIVGVAGEVAILNHQHPGFTILDQAQPKGFSQGVSRTQEARVALAAEQVTQAVPG